MKIKIEDNLYITSDDRQFILGYEKTRVVKNKDTGEEREETYMDNYGYYSSLQGAVKALLTKKIKDSKATDLKSLLADLERLRIYIESKVAV